MLYHAHSGLRYLVLLAAVAAIVALAYALASGRAFRAARISAAAFAGVLDLQIVLGLGLLMSGRFPPEVVGHLALMVFAAVITHAAAIIGQRSPSERREIGIRLAGIVVALALIVAGIMMIGRSVLGSQPSFKGSESLNGDDVGVRSMSRSATLGARMLPCLECQGPSRPASRCT